MHASDGHPRHVAATCSLKTSEESHESQWTQNSPSVVFAHSRFEADKSPKPSVVFSVIHVHGTDNNDEDEDNAVVGVKVTPTEEDKKQREDMSASAVNIDLRMGARPLQRR